MEFQIEKYYLFVDEWFVHQILTEKFNTHNTRTRQHTGKYNNTFFA